MRVDRRSVMGGSLAALILGILVTGTSGGCSGSPPTGTQAVETPEVQKEREDGVKSAMERGSYGDQYKTKAAPSK